MLELAKSVMTVASALVNVPVAFGILLVDAVLLPAAVLLANAVGTDSVAVAQYPM
jgi:hypothetical protein